MKKITILVVIAFAFLMPVKSQNLVTYSTPAISIDAPDTIINNTILKRKATLFAMAYNQASKTLVLTWVVRYYADSTGHYGRALNDIIPDYSKESIADNTTKVNAITGAIINGVPIVDYMGQYDYFYKVATEQPIIVNDLIEFYGYGVQNWNK